LEGLAVEHAFVVFSVFEVDELAFTHFAVELKDLSLSSEGLEHAFAFGAEEHSVDLEEVTVFLERDVPVVELIIFLFLSQLLFKIGAA
jgi:hypothetical protein